MNLKSTLIALAGSFLITVLVGCQSSDKVVEIKKNFKTLKEQGCGKLSPEAGVVLVAIYMFAADGESGAEVYSGFTTEKQAWEVFRPARRMCLKTPELVSHFGIEVNAKNLNIQRDDSRFEP